MTKMRAAQFSRPGGPLELVERDIPAPGPGQVRIKVQACGICHSDSITQEGHFPGGVSYPRIPGHEVIGVIDALGPGAAPWTPGMRVGIGWHGGNCNACGCCRRGDAFACETATNVTGLTCDGGYAEYMVAPVTALARVPDGLSAVDAAPIMCAGLTTFNAIRNSGARHGETVAVLGLGGLGHMAVQYAAKMGFRTIAIARGEDKAPLATKLGAARYIDSQASDPAAELAKLGGAKAVIATVTEGKAMSAVLGGLAINGTFMVIGATMSMEVSPLFLLAGRRSVKGWYSGTSIDSEQTLDYSVLTGVRAMNEEFPLAQAPEAYARMLSGKARFRVVLKIAP